MKLIILTGIFVISGCSLNPLREPAKEKNQDYVMTTNLQKDIPIDMSIDIHRPVFNQDHLQEMVKIHLDLQKDSDFSELNQIIVQLYAISSSQKAVNQVDSGIKNKDSDIVFDYRSKGIHHGLELSLQIIKKIKQISNLNDIQQLKMDLAEILRGIENNFISHERSKYDIALLPLTLLKLIAYHRVELQNFQEISDPEPSSFWQKPRSDFNYFTGSEGHGTKWIDESVCEYLEAKFGYGVKAGFKASCDGVKYKIKFGGETYSGPFNSRIYNALGYLTPMIEYTNGIKIKYDRRILTEINSRKPLKLKLSIFGMGNFSKTIFKKYNPFDFIDYAILKDGQKISRNELAKKLIHSNSDLENLQDSNFSYAFEKNISFLKMTAGSVIEKIKGDQVGAWSFNQLGHNNRPEIKALMVLAAWTNNSDLRLDNNRLYITNNKTSQKIVHYISDPGYGMGRASFPLRGGNLNTIPWEITRTVLAPEGDGRANFIEFYAFNDMEKNKAFDQITYAEAKWMVRKIAALSEAQLTEALVGSGLSAAEVILVREKLISSRNQMIQDFDLQQEFSSRTINKKISFDPTQEELVLNLSTGGTVKVPDRGISVKKGVLIYP